TVGSAFSWIVSDAEVCRMNSVTAPSRARASRTNFATSAVRSVKPAPDVCTVSSEDTMVLALTVDDAERERDLGVVMTQISPHVVPANAGPHNPRHSLFSNDINFSRANSRGRGVWVPAFAGTTR